MHGTVGWERGEGGNSTLNTYIIFTQNEEDGGYVVDLGRCHVKHSEDYGFYYLLYYGCNGYN